MGLVYCALAGCASFKFLDGLALVACHGGILSSLSDGIVCRHHRSPALAMKPAGEDPGSATALGTMHSTALLGEKSQSFPDNLIACFPPSRSTDEVAGRALGVALYSLIKFNECHDVRFWPLADIPSCTAHVRFWGM